MTGTLTVFMCIILIELRLSVPPTALMQRCFSLPAQSLRLCLATLASCKHVLSEQLTGITPLFFKRAVVPVHGRGEDLCADPRHVHKSATLNSSPLSIYLPTVTRACRSDLTLGLPLTLNGVKSSSLGLRCTRTAQPWQSNSQPSEMSCSFSFSL